MSAMIELVAGAKYGDLTVLRREGTDHRGEATWRCACACGSECVSKSYALRRGVTTHCGCMKNKHISDANNKNLGNTPSLRYAWTNMKTRCNNPRYPLYHRYGGRGIRVCDAWQNSFEEFLRWAYRAGWTQGLSLDRIDNDKGYSPENCRFVTAQAQANNRCTSKIVEAFGAKESLANVARRYGVPYEKLQRRIARGEWPEAAINSLMGGQR